MEAIEKFYRSSLNGPVDRNNLLDSLRRFWKFCSLPEADGGLGLREFSSDPARLIRRDAETPRSPRLDQEMFDRVQFQLEDIFQRRPTWEHLRNAVFFAVLRSSGARPVEICRLRRSNLMLGEDVALLPGEDTKTQESRFIALPLPTSREEKRQARSAKRRLERGREMLEEYLRAHQEAFPEELLPDGSSSSVRLFCDRPTRIHHPQMLSSSFYHIFKKIADGLGLRGFIMYAIRHGVGTSLVKKGVPLAQVAHFLGHRSIGTTFRNYVHLDRDDLRETAAVLRSDSSQPQEASTQNPTLANSPVRRSSAESRKWGNLGTARVRGRKGR